MLDDYCKKLKYRRRIVLVTSGRACMDDDGVDEIARKVGADGIELTIVYGSNVNHAALGTVMADGVWSADSTLMIRILASRKKTRNRQKYARR